MKLESLIIIFVIIIIPMTLVLSEYTNNRITTAKLELQYNTKLLDATYDAVRAFQINNVKNSYNDITTSKVKDIEYGVNAFFNSAETNFGFAGYRSDVMKEYVPAVVFTLYDGYYIYSPFTNTLTTTLDSSGEPELKSGASYGNDENVDPNYRDGETLNGLKPYVYYSCRYKYGMGTNASDFVITYTLDNYITVQGIVNGTYEYRYGYLINGIQTDGHLIGGQTDSYGYQVYDAYKDKNTGLSFSLTDTEMLTEYADNTNTLYPYVKINGIKYYLENPNVAFDLENPNNTKIFYYDEKGGKNYYQFQNNADYKNKLYNAIKSNKSSYEYYKDAYGFTNWVNQNLKDLDTSNASLINSIGGRNSN